MSSCIRDWKCIIVANISLEYKITNQNSSFWISLTSHFVALSQKSMKVAFFQRFVEYNRPTWNRIVRHIVCHTQSEGARRVSDSSTRISERGFPCSVPVSHEKNDFTMPSLEKHPCQHKIEENLAQRPLLRACPYRNDRDVQLPMLALLALNVANSLLIIITC